jgi:cyclopropane fatty-acyl-phospholipid synthase-like methyltransferase
MQELFTEDPQLDLEFVCVDGDPAAVDYARQQLPNHDSAVRFECRNILRYRPQGRFHLIWSAGLFDYFDDRTFVRLLSRLLPSLTPGGELAVGNFGPRNTTRGYMEAIAKWYLNHRTATSLMALAERAGFGGQHDVDVRSEPSGVNLFLHIVERKRTSRADHRHHGVKPATTPTLWVNSADYPKIDRS